VVRQDVARFRYSPSADKWTLFCQYPDLKWHTYEFMGPRKRFDAVLAEVDDDSTGIFWG
jgi:hypothetical protein